MKSSSLDSKTIRPGLMNYSFYRSDRHPAGRRTPAKAKAKPQRHYGRKLLTLLVLVVIAGAAIAVLRNSSNPQPSSTGPTQAAAVAQGPQQCAGNSLDKQIIVSINERHLWACQYHKVAYDSPVVTGMENLPADLTPRGTYHIYAKQTNVTLTGSDSTGNWSDPVSYWMPFLDNQYGTYGFHDASWRKNSDFGSINPNSSNASHGCVELPQATSKWLYGWAQVGTTVTIKN